MSAPAPEVESNTKSPPVAMGDFLPSAELVARANSTASDTPVPFFIEHPRVIEASLPVPFHPRCIALTGGFILDSIPSGEPEELSKIQVHLSTVGSGVQEYAEILSRCNVGHGVGIGRDGVHIAGKIVFASHLESRCAKDRRRQFSLGTSLSRLCTVETLIVDELLHIKDPLDYFVVICDDAASLDTKTQLRNLGFYFVRVVAVPPRGHDSKRLTAVLGDSVKIRSGNLSPLIQGVSDYHLTLLHSGLDSDVYAMHELACRGGDLENLDSAQLHFLKQLDRCWHYRGGHHTAHGLPIEPLLLKSVLYRGYTADRDGDFPSIDVVRRENPNAIRRSAPELATAITEEINRLENALSIGDTGATDKIVHSIQLSLEVLDMVWPTMLPFYRMQSLSVPTAPTTRLSMERVRGLVNQFNRTAKEEDKIRLGFVPSEIWQ
jgi:hypothetical protein